MYITCLLKKLRHISLRKLRQNLGNHANLQIRNYERITQIPAATVHIYMIYGLVEVLSDEKEKIDFNWKWDGWFKDNRTYFGRKQLPL